MLKLQSRKLTLKTPKLKVSEDDAKYFTEAEAEAKAEARNEH